MKRIVFVALLISSMDFRPAIAATNLDLARGMDCDQVASALQNVLGEGRDGHDKQHFPEIQAGGIPVSGWDANVFDAFRSRVYQCQQTKSRVDIADSIMNKLLDNIGNNIRSRRGRNETKEDAYAAAMARAVARDLKDVEDDLLRVESPQITSTEMRELLPRISDELARAVIPADRRAAFEKRLSAVQAQLARYDKQYVEKNQGTEKLAIAPGDILSGSEDEARHKALASVEKAFRAAEDLTDLNQLPGALESLQEALTNPSLSSDNRKQFTARLKFLEQKATDMAAANNSKVNSDQSAIPSNEGSTSKSDRRDMLAALVAKDRDKGEDVINVPIPCKDHIVLKSVRDIIYRRLLRYIWVASIIDTDETYAFIEGVTTLEQSDRHVTCLAQARLQIGLTDEGINASHSIGNPLGNAAAEMQNSSNVVMRISYEARVTDSIDRVYVDLKYLD